MSQGQQDRIRERAYLLWERDGGAHGDDWNYWLMAEREITAEDEVTAPPAAPRAPRKTSTGKTSTGKTAPNKAAAPKTKAATKTTARKTAAGKSATPKASPKKAPAAKVTEKA